MAVAGLCDVCGAPGTLHSCALCGRRVCEAHFDHAARACSRHGPGAGPGRAPPHGRT